MDMLSKKYFLLELPFFLLEIDTSQLAKNEKIVPTCLVYTFSIPHRPKSVFFEKNFSHFIGKMYLELSFPSIPKNPN